MTVTDKLQAVVDTLGVEDVLMQLAEECTELAHAAHKVRRVMRHTTPVSKQRAALMLHEETADVALCLDALRLAGLLDVDRATRIAQEKLNRWYNRTCGKDGT